MLTFFRIGLEDEEVELLLDLSATLGQKPTDLLSRLVRDILIDDADAHGVRPRGHKKVAVSGPIMH